MKQLLKIIKCILKSYELSMIERQKYIEEYLTMVEMGYPVGHPMGHPARHRL